MGFQEVSFSGRFDLSTTEPVRLVAASSSGEYIWFVAGNTLFYCRLANETSPQVAQVPFETDLNVPIVSLGVFGDCAVIGTANGIHVVEKDGTVTNNLEMSSTRVTCCAVDAASGRCFVGFDSYEGEIGLVTLHTAASTSTGGDSACISLSIAANELTRKGEMVTSIAVFTGHGEASFLCVVGTERGCVRWISAAGSVVHESFDEMEAHGASRVLWCDPDTGTVWSGHEDGTIATLLPDNEQGVVSCRLLQEGHSDQVTAIQASPGEFKVWSCSHDHTAIAWDSVLQVVLLRVDHSAAVIGMLGVGRATVWRKLAVGMTGEVQCYLSQAVFSGGEEVLELQELLDETMRELAKKQEELRQYRIKLLVDPFLKLQDTVVLEEKRSRAMLYATWADATELLLVSFFLGLATVRRVEEQLHTAAVVTPVKRQTLDGGVGTSPALCRTDPSVVTALEEKDRQIAILHREIASLKRQHDRRTANDEEEIVTLHQRLQDLEAVLLQSTQEKESADQLLAISQTKMDSLLFEIATSRRTASRLEGEVSALRIDLDESKLELLRVKEQHEVQQRRLLDDTAALRRPWERMQQTLRSKELEIESVRAELTEQIASLKVQLAAQSKSGRLYR